MPCHEVPLDDAHVPVQRHEQGKTLDEGQDQDHVEDEQVAAVGGGQILARDFNPGV